MRNIATLLWLSIATLYVGAMNNYSFKIGILLPDISITRPTQGATNNSTLQKFIADDIPLDIAWNNYNNITGKPILYTCNISPENMSKLKNAQIYAKEKGYNIVVRTCNIDNSITSSISSWIKSLDTTTQNTFYPNVEKYGLSANVYLKYLTVESNNYIETGLLDINGNYLPMGSVYQSLVYNDYTSGDTVSTTNKRMLKDIMEHGGFTATQIWWLFKSD